VPRRYSVPLTGHMALTIFSEGKEGRSPWRRKQENRRTHEKIAASLRPEIAKQDNVLAPQGYLECHGSTQVQASNIRKDGVWEGAEAPSMRLCGANSDAHWVNNVCPRTFTSWVEGTRTFQSDVGRRSLRN
jgi:hypothetical protein